MFHSISTCFCDEKVNTGRQVELDVAKGFAIIFMVLCHAFEVLSQWTSPALELWLDSILGGPFAAVVFMFCMGISINYSKSSTPAVFFARGCKLILYGFLLELLRDGVPVLVCALYYHLFSTPEGVLAILDYAISCIDVDILQFAGLFFIIFSVLKKVNISNIGLLVLAMALSFAGGILRNVSTGSFWADIAASYFWRSRSESYFPFLNWFIIPIVGLNFGSIWLHCKDKQQFYRRITPIASTITVLYSALYPFHAGIFNHNSYYGIDLVGAFFAVILALAFVGISYFIGRRFPLVAKPLCWMSANITSLYCVHWCIVSLCAVILYYLDISLPDSAIIPAGILIVFTSCVIVHFYDNHKKHISSAQK